VAVGAILDGIVTSASLRSMEVITDPERVTISFAAAILGAAAGLFIGVYARKIADARDEQDERRARCRGLWIATISIAFFYLTLLALLAYARAEGARSQILDGAPNISTGWMIAAGLLVFALGAAFAFVAADHNPSRRASTELRSAERRRSTSARALQRARENKIDAVAELEHASRLAAHWLEEELGLWALLHATHENERIRAFLSSCRGEREPVPAVRPLKTDALEEMIEQTLTPLRFQVEAAAIPASLRTSLLRRLQDDRIPTPNMNGSDR
jgi:uncharacterized membrane protein (DUF485 family)